QRNDAAAQLAPNPLHSNHSFLLRRRQRVPDDALKIILPHAAVIPARRGWLSRSHAGGVGLESYGHCNDAPTTPVIAWPPGPRIFTPPDEVRGRSSGKRKHRDFQLSFR